MAEQIYAGRDHQASRRWCRAGGEDIAVIENRMRARTVAYLDSLADASVPNDIAALLVADTPERQRADTEAWRRRMKDTPNLCATDDGRLVAPLAARLRANQENTK